MVDLISTWGIGSGSYRVACRVEILNQQYANVRTEAMFCHFHPLPFVQFQGIKQASYNFCQDRINSLGSHIQRRVAFAASQYSSKCKILRCSHFKQFIHLKYLKCLGVGGGCSLMDHCISTFQQIHFCCFTPQESSFITKPVGSLCNQNSSLSSAKPAYTSVLVILKVISENLVLLLFLFYLYFFPV